MVLIEFIQGLFFLACRLIIWIFTARDCEHCKWGYEYVGKGMCCAIDDEQCEECLNTVHRKHFKRDCYILSNWRK